MPTYFVLNVFRRWLKDNRKRFHYPPYIAHIQKTSFEIRFRGIDPRLRWNMGKNGACGIWVEYHGQCWDAIAEFDVFPERSAAGRYYCTQCMEPESYPTRRELWIKHSWEPMLEWVNEKLTPTTWACIFQLNDGGSTMVALKQEHEVEVIRRKEECFRDAFPVVVGKGSGELDLL